MKKIKTLVVSLMLLSITSPLMADNGVARNYSMMPPMYSPNMASMMHGQGGPMMNPQNMQQMMGNQSMGRSGYAYPQAMQQMMNYKQGHMAKIEGLLTSIDASLKQLVAQGDQK